MSEDILKLLNEIIQNTRRAPEDIVKARHVRGYRIVKLKDGITLKAMAHPRPVWYMRPYWWFRCRWSSLK